MLSHFQIKKTKESVEIANETNIVAIQSNDIAQKIVEDAEDKKVKGKEDVVIRKQLIDLNYRGNCGRKIEKKLKNNEIL